MINEAYKAMLGGKSVIRELSEYATARGAEIGYENVFDYSLGNPSVPCPQDYTDAVIDMYKTAEPVALHGYSPSLGIPSVRKAIADHPDSVKLGELKAWTIDPAKTAAARGRIADLIITLQ